MRVPKMKTFVVFLAVALMLPAAGQFSNRRAPGFSLADSKFRQHDPVSYTHLGTYSVAVLAKENDVPFYVAAPISTLDLTLPDGRGIPIEERAAKEVTHVFGMQVAPTGTDVRNPAFDVTPNRYVTAIITERGVARAPFEESLRDLAQSQL